MIDNELLLIETINELLNPKTELKSVIKEDKYGKYVDYKNIDLSNFSNKEIRYIITKYLENKFLNKFLFIDKDRIKVTKHGIKKMRNYTNNDIEKSYIELDKITKIATYENQELNSKSNEFNAPIYRYYISRLKVNNTMFVLRIVVRVPITNEQSAYIYSIQIKKKPIGTPLDVAPTDLNQIKVR